jgi:hypothetical protein
VGLLVSTNNRHLLVTPLPSALFVHRLIHSDFRDSGGYGWERSQGLRFDIILACGFQPKLWGYKAYKGAD